jgi:hypothetical protein
MEVLFVDKFFYEDVLSFKPVSQMQVEELNFVNSLYDILEEFNKKVELM